MRRHGRTAAIIAAPMLFAQPATAAVMLDVEPPVRPCHLDSLACEPAYIPVSGSQDLATAPAVAAVLGIVLLWLALGRQRRSGLRQVAP